MPGAAGGGEAGGAGEVAAGVRAAFTLRRVRVDPGRKRVEFVGRLEALMGELDGVISDPGGYGDLQVRAMNTLIGAIRMCYRIVVDVERLEVELEGLKEEKGGSGRAGIPDRGGPCPGTRLSSAGGGWGTSRIRTCGRS